MSNRQKALEYAAQNHERFLDELIDVLRIPSISTDAEYNNDVLRAAEWMADHLRGLGIENVEIMPTDGGHPVVYGDYIKAPGGPIVLVYGHYDVQPADPLELWESGPFEPRVHGDLLYGRGASDMKGQVLATFHAVESMLKSGALDEAGRNGSAPVNLKFLLEGEEEIGSKHLEPFLEKHAQKFKADVSLNPDAGMMGVDMPTITYGLRGLAYFEVHVSGPKADLHSGLYGGVVHNPAQALAELIAKMHDAKGAVTLPGFYDSVRPVTEQERADFGRLPNNEAHYLKETGVPALWGEDGYLPAERTGARPTLEVNGLLSGWTGPGSKTVLPARAMAKISCRLVPDQTDDQVEVQLMRFMQENTPKTVTWEVRKLTGSPFAIADLDNPGVKAMHAAMEAVWGRRPYYRREGGSIGAVAMLQQICGVESVLVGMGLPSDNVHSPNEHLHLPTWRKGIEAFIHFFYNLEP
ncbi:MAG TPA: dipeptidase [Anaerolineales bacterium]|nr:dipeptidase [Anaerolineales bacterium]